MADQKARIYERIPIGVITMMMGSHHPNSIAHS
jgi:hypothetical protein